MFVEIAQYCKSIRQVPILVDISYSFELGRIYGLRGKNGSGKTMLLRAISGLILPSSGHIDIDGKRLGKDIAFPNSMGLLIENPAFIGKYTGLKNLKMIASLKNVIDTAQIEETLRNVGLNPADKRPYRKYSLGMKQRLGIACAVMEQPDIILLDEPLNALDPTGVEQVRNILFQAKRQGALIVVAGHDDEELELLSDEIITMAEGKIVSIGVVHHDE